MSAPQINTYHCLCTSLLLATTHNLSSLPRRAPPSLDSAIIIPLPPAPQQLSAASSPSSPSDEDSEGEDVSESRPERPRQTQLSELGYTLLLSTITDRRPAFIRRSDGFETRYLVRCGRCRLVVGYELDAEHYATSSTAGGAPSDSVMDIDGEEPAQQEKQRTKFVYLLPGGIVSTEVMASGKKIGEKEVVLGETEQAGAVAAWE